MDIAKKEKNYALISAILFTVYTVLTLCEDVYYRLEDLRAFPEYGINVASLILDAMFYVSLIIIIVALFRKSKTALTVGTAATVLFSAIPYIMNLIMGNYDALGEEHSTIGKIFVLSIAAYAVLLLMLILSFRKADAVIKHLWFLPSLIILIYYIIYYAVATIEYSFNIIYIKGIAIAIVQAAALFFAGLWLNVGARSADTKDDEQPVGVS